MVTDGQRLLTQTGVVRLSDTEEEVPFGAALRRRRLAAGLSLRALAERIHYSKPYLSKIETGQRRPSLELARQCDTALRADGALLALVPQTGTGRTPATAGPGDDEWTISLDSQGRGGFGAITNRNSRAIGAVTPLTWAMPPAVGTGHYGPAELRSFRTMFDEMRRAGHAMAPAALLPILIAQTHALRLLARAGGPGVRTEALYLASRFAEYTGWLAQEAGDDRGALWWTDLAVEYATMAGDRDLAAFALVRRGLVAMYRYDARETIAVAKQAQAAQCSARVRGLAALREAQGHALAGDYNLCRRRLDRAATLLAAARNADDGRPPLGSTTVADPVAMVTGWCLYDLGRAREALPYLATEFAAVPAYAHRTRARIGVRYALALVAAGELEHACAVTEGVLDSAIMTDSATVRVDLRRLAQELSRRSGHRAVRAVMPALIAALSTAYR